VTTVRLTSIGAARLDGGSRLAGETPVQTAPVGVPATVVAVPLDSIEGRNNLYRELAPELSIRAVSQALGSREVGDIGCLVTSSCTGYAVPGWAVDVVETFELPPTTVRVPLTESGCAGGTLAIARAADYLRSRPGEAALAVATELSSVCPPPQSDDVLSSLIFGDGSGAALLETGPGNGLEVVDGLSYLVPRSKDELGSDLTDLGFHPVVSGGLEELVPAPTELAVATLLARQGLRAGDIDAWLLHPCGEATLRAVEDALGVDGERTRWSWSTLLESGDTSSAAIFDVLAGYLDESPPGHRWAVLAAFGPGVSIELLLLAAAARA
jgi:predicted naringenin-chalcone synthase